MKARGAGLWLTIVIAVIAVVLLPSAASAKKPIVYVVVVDGLDGDSVDAAQLPFVSSVLAGEDGNGSYFPNSSSVIPAETNPNHTAMMTGAFPDRSGIAANAFALYAPLASDDTCERTGPFDFSVAPMETSGESPSCPQAETIFEAVRRQVHTRRPVTSVIMGKPKLGRIFDVDFKGKRRAADHIWSPCTSSPEDDEYCESVPTNPITGYAANDTIVMDEVIETMNEGVTVRGKVRQPHFTFVNLPQVDSAGHALGRGPAYNAAISMADMEIERLADALKAKGLWDRAMVFVVSDHSMDTTPQKITLADEFAGAGIAESSFVTVMNGSVDFIYLADRTAPRKKRDKLLKQMRETALATPGVAEALYRKRNEADGNRRRTIAKVRPKWTAGRRTGDLVVTSEEGFAFSEGSPPGNPLIGNHGAPQTADNTMLVIGGSRQIRTRTVEGKGRNKNPFNVDIAATVMRLFGLKPPKNSKGVALRPAFKKKALKLK